MPNRSQRGFTLIELLVVTAIIAIIANQATVKAIGALYKGKRAGVTLYTVAMRNALVMHYIDKSAYPVCSSAPCTFGGLDLSEYLKDGGYLDQTFAQAQRSWGQSHDPMLFAYRSTGLSYEFAICFMGTGSSYLEDRCVTVKNEGSIDHVPDPPSWAPTAP